MKVPASKALGLHHWQSRDSGELRRWQRGRRRSFEVAGRSDSQSGRVCESRCGLQEETVQREDEAGIDAKLLLGLALSAYARAWAGAFGIQGEIRKDWILAQRQIDTRLGFYVKAPFEYADDTGIKLPELKDIEYS